MLEKVFLYNMEKLCNLSENFMRESGESNYQNS